MTEFARGGVLVQLTEDQIAAIGAAASGGAGGATEAKQDTIIGHLDGVEGSLTSILAAIAAELIVKGTTAHDAALTDAPLAIGGLAKTANPAVVADGDAVYAVFDKRGRQLAVGALRENLVQAKIQLSGTTTETTLLAAGGVGVFHDCYSIRISNTSATPCAVEIRDATGGTLRETIMVPAGEYRGFVLPLDGARPQTAANNNWTAKALSSVAAIEVAADFVKNV